MGKRKGKQELALLERVTIVDAGSEGRAVARVEGQVVFVPLAVPGDVVDIQLTRQRKRFLEGRVVRIHHRSERRADPFCNHFGTCGGCSWQHMRYADQLFFKQKLVVENLNRIGKVSGFELHPILPSPLTQFYRNKLEFTFSNRGWLTREELETRHPEAGMERWEPRNALGFHIPGMFDRVLDIKTCYLQGEPSNPVRLAMKELARERKLTFYDVRNRTGFLRNLLIRTSSSGEVMVILVVGTEDRDEVTFILNRLSELFPAITSLYYLVNGKHNDSLSGQAFHLFQGEPYLTERMPPYRKGDPDLLFMIGPTSFFQTNSTQAAALYRTVADFAGLHGRENVYDLYTGTGSIAIYLARYAGTVTGIESVGPAITDATQNALRNGLSNTAFLTGEVERLLNPAFIEVHGKPDVIITDPPRSGMHEKGIRAILASAPETLVYVSCNPSTQARDIALMGDHYRLIKCQPVDMFPHTQHVENVALLKRIA